MAPESYFDGTWDLKSDVWMFGVLLWGLLQEDVALLVQSDCDCISQSCSAGQTCRGTVCLMAM